MLHAKTCKNERVFRIQTVNSHAGEKIFVYICYLYSFLWKNSYTCETATDFNLWKNVLVILRKWKKNAFCFTFNGSSNVWFSAFREAIVKELKDNTPSNSSSIWL